MVFNKHRELLEKLFPLHRTLVSDDMGKAMGIIQSFLPQTSNFKLHGFPSGSKCWTWRIPKKFTVNEAKLTLETGQVIADFHVNPLHLVSYSQSKDEVLSFEELKPHLYSNPGRPSAIPWVFKYYSESWGFCLPHNVFQKLPRDKKYHVHIDTTFDDGELLVGEYTIDGMTDQELIVISDICHPCQANDSLTGANLGMELIHRFESQAQKPRYTLRFLFLPETIGSVAYLSQREGTLNQIQYALFSDSIGTSGKLKIQRSLVGDTLVDKAAENVIQETLLDATLHTFRSVVGNDELIFEGPSVRVPTISLVRHPFAEYHTSEDRPEIVSVEQIIEAANVADNIFEQLMYNFYPVQNFKGVLFLSGYDLFINKQENYQLNKAIEKILMMLDGSLSLVEISHETGVPFRQILSFILEMDKKKLITKIYPEQKREFDAVALDNT